MPFPFLIQKLFRVRIVQSELFLDYVPQHLRFSLAAHRNEPFRHGGVLADIQFLYCGHSLLCRACRGFKKSLRRLIRLGIPCAHDKSVFYYSCRHFQQFKLQKKRQNVQLRNRQRRYVLKCIEITYDRAFVELTVAMVDYLPGDGFNSERICISALVYKRKLCSVYPVKLTFNGQHGFFQHIEILAQGHTDCLHAF